jgi:DNA-binding GntR family transcriptional regulator
VVDDFIQSCDVPALEAMENAVLIQIKCIGKKNYKEFFAADNEFHKIIFETANECLAWTTVNDLVSHYNRFRIMSTRLEGIDQNIISEHERILKAAKDRNAAQMKEFLEVHLNKVSSQLGRLLDTYPQYFVEVK